MGPIWFLQTFLERFGQRAFPLARVYLYQLQNILTFTSKETKNFNNFLLNIEQQMARKLFGKKLA